MGATGRPVAKGEFEGIVCGLSLPSHLVYQCQRIPKVNPTTSLCVACPYTFHFKVSILVTGQLL